jgi:hypothetical protein
VILPSLWLRTALCCSCGVCVFQWCCGVCVRALLFVVLLVLQFFVACFCGVVVARCSLLFLWHVFLCGLTRLIAVTRGAACHRDELKSNRARTHAAGTAKSSVRPQRRKNACRTAARREQQRAPRGHKYHNTARTRTTGTTRRSVQPQHPQDHTAHTKRPETATPQTRPVQTQTRADTRTGTRTYPTKPAPTQKPAPGADCSCDGVAAWCAVNYAGPGRVCLDARVCTCSLCAGRAG